MSAKPSPSLPVQLLAITVARLVINTGLRLTYPFLPELARGLGVPLTAVAQLVTLRNLTGLVSPIFGPLSDRFGRRPLITAASLLFGLGCFTAVIWPAYWPFAAALIVMALGKVLFDPAMQAHLGDTVPYAMRGRAVAVTELSWAGALLLGAPAVGLALQRQGWTAPFFWLGLMGIAMAWLLWRSLPDDGLDASRIGGWRDIVRVVRQERVIWAAFLYVLLIMAANELILIVYGDWMESSFGLSLTSLGLAAGVIGGAEIVGEVTAGWGTDRFGKRPVIITAALATSILYGLLPYVGGSLTPALVSLFTLFVGFEMTVVGGIPLMTEIVPRARGVVLSMVVAAASLGRATGSLLGPLIWLRGGLVGNGLVAAAMMLLATIILVVWIREKRS